MIRRSLLPGFSESSRGLPEPEDEEITLLRSLVFNSQHGVTSKETLIHQKASDIAIYFTVRKSLRNTRNRKPQAATSNKKYSACNLLELHEVFFNIFSFFVVYLMMLSIAQII
jgi:hypothetical protein